MMEQLKEAIAFSAMNPHDKHVDVLLRSSALCREMGGVTIILCKSGESFVCLLLRAHFLLVANLTDNRWRRLLFLSFILTPFSPIFCPLHRQGQNVHGSDT